MPEHRDSFLRLKEPCYVFSGNSRWRKQLRKLYPSWQKQLNGLFPHAPPDYLTLLNPDNRLSFRLLGYGEHYQAAKVLREATLDAQYLRLSAGGRTGADDTEIGRLGNLLPGLDGTGNTIYRGCYIAAVIYRERKSREEFIVIVGLVDQPDTCFTIRFSELDNDLTFRFTPQQPRNGIAAVDFCLQATTTSESHLHAFIREHSKITQDFSINPWTIRDGAAVYDPRRYSSCREVPFSDGYLAKTGEWVIPTVYRKGVLYESAKIF